MLFGFRAKPPHKWRRAFFPLHLAVCNLFPLQSSVVMETWGLDVMNVNFCGENFHANNAANKKKTNQPSNKQTKTCYKNGIWWTPCPPSWNKFCEPSNKPTNKRTNKTTRARRCAVNNEQNHPQKVRTHQTDAKKSIACRNWDQGWVGWYQYLW